MTIYSQIAWLYPYRRSQPTVREFDNLQTRGIRAAFGAYRSTPERPLQSETASQLWTYTWRVSTRQQ